MTERDADELLEAYAEVADHRARRISELVAEREELRRRLAARDDVAAQQVARLEVENARLAREVRGLRARLDRMTRFPPYRVARALRRTLPSRRQPGRSR